jgi:hypothetical protein
MKPLPAELEAKIDEVKLWLPNGAIASIAKETNTAASNVSNMFNKKITMSDKVLKEGIRIMNERKAKFEISQTPKMKVA